MTRHRPIVPPKTPFCAGCGQPWAGTPCPCSEGSLEPWMTYPTTAKQVQVTYRRLKGQVNRAAPDFVSIEEMQREMKDLF